MRGVENGIQWQNLRRLVHWIVRFVMFRVVAFVGRMGLVWAHLVPYFHVSVALRALSWKIRRYHVTRRACLKSNSIEAHGKLRQRQGKLTPRCAKTIWDFWSFFSEFSRDVSVRFGQGCVQTEFSYMCMCGKHPDLPENPLGKD